MTNQPSNGLTNRVIEVNQAQILFVGYKKKHANMSNQLTD